MADNSNLDWWQKPEHLKDKPAQQRQQPQQPRSRKAKAPKAPKPPVTVKGLSMRLAKHIAIIVTSVVVIAVIAHFSLTTITRHGAHYTVPQLEQLTVAEAERVAADGKLNLVINDSLYATKYGPGVILAQLPEAGVVVKPGRTIYLTINATQRRMVPIPYVAGRSLRQARNMLDIAGLTIKRLVYQDDLATNYVLEQHYGKSKIIEGGKAVAPMGSGVTLTVGRGESGLTAVPLLLGMTLDDARGALWDAGLNVGSVDMGKDIDVEMQKLVRVESQSVRPVSEVELGSDVSFKVTLNQDVVNKALATYGEERKIEIKMEQAAKDSLELINFR